MSEVLTADDERRTWVLWLLVVGAVTLGGLAVTAKDPALGVAFGVGGAVDLALLIGVLFDRLQADTAVKTLLILGLVLGIGVEIDVLAAARITVAEASFLLFRASVLISGVAFLAAGPRTGSVVALGYVLSVLIVLAVVGAPAVGDDRHPGTFELACLLVAVVAIFRALSVQVRRLEHTALRASADAALAYRDDLTALPNRRFMTQLLDEASASAEDRRAAVMMFDLDHFKTVNDTLGHNVGDEVLQRTSALATAALRDSDQVGRWGGEEFLAVLTGLDLDAAVRVAERTRRAMADVSGPTGVTASFGVTSVVPGEPVDGIVARADQALYAAKRAGRDQVWICTAGAEPQRAPIEGAASTKTATAPLPAPPGPGTAPSSSADGDLQRHHQDDIEPDGPEDDEEVSAGTHDRDAIDPWQPR